MTIGLCRRGVLRLLPGIVPIRHPHLRLLLTVTGGIPRVRGVIGRHTMIDHVNGVEKMTYELDPPRLGIGKLLTGIVLSAVCRLPGILGGRRVKNVNDGPLSQILHLHVRLTALNSVL
jgi:hypothetical protein